MMENEIMTELENLLFELNVVGVQIKQLRDKIAKEQDKMGMALEKEATLRQDL